MFHHRVVMPGQEENIIWVIAIGTVAFLFSGLFVASLVFFYARRHNLFLTKARESEIRFQQELMQSKIETQEETFSALSKELHDNIGQLLNSTKLFIGIASRKAISSPEILQMAGDSLSKAIGEIRTLSKALDKEWLERFNFLENLSAEVERLNLTGEFSITTTSEGSFYLPSEQQIILFRIVQEALQNAIKHAAPSNIHIHAASHPETLKVSVTDDGSGFHASEAVTGNGFANMRHRTSLLRGQIAWESREGSGTSVIITIPIQNEPYENYDRYSG